MSSGAPPPQWATCTKGCKSECLCRLAVKNIVAFGTETLTVQQGGTADPSACVPSTLVVLDGVWQPESCATGTLAPGTVDGQIKNIVVIATPLYSCYTLTVPDNASIYHFGKRDGEYSSLSLQWFGSSLLASGGRWGKTSASKAANERAHIPLQLLGIADASELSTPGLYHSGGPVHALFQYTADVDTDLTVELMRDGDVLNTQSVVLSSADSTFVVSFTAQSSGPVWFRVINEGREADLGFLTFANWQVLVPNITFFIADGLVQFTTTADIPAADIASFTGGQNGFRATVTRAGLAGNIVYAPPDNTTIGATTNTIDITKNNVMTVSRTAAPIPDATTFSLDFTDVLAPYVYFSATIELLT